MPYKTGARSGTSPSTCQVVDRPLAVVIGAGGMGSAVARRLALRNRVLAVDLEETHLDSLAASVRVDGGEIETARCDITDEDAVRAMAERVEALGGFRYLAHVTGLSPAAGDFRAIVRVNLLGVALVLQALRPLAVPGSAALLVSSMAGHRPPPPDELTTVLRTPLDGCPAERLADLLDADDATPAVGYTLSKWGVIDYARRAAVDWGRDGARVVSLSPGMIATPMGAAEFERSPQKRRLFEATPLAREGTMLEICDAVEFLLSDAASFITGTDLLVDGGLTAAASEKEGFAAEARPDQVT